MPTMSSKRRPVTAGAGAGRLSPDKITNYTTAVRWLHEHANFERLRFVPYNERMFSLDRMHRLLEMLDRPDRKLKCVQIAGTKGKGSSCAMLASILSAAGYAVGLYSSPHLVDLRERITIGGAMVPYAEMAETLKRIATEEAKVFGEDRPSFFELMTATALRYFADQAVDVAILETGLGGRLDSTTAVQPLVCGMTQVSLDHTNLLGNDLASIAREKAGIFKKGVPAVSVSQDPSVTAVFVEQAEQAGAPLEFTGEQIEFSSRFEANRELGPHTRVSVTTPQSSFEHLAVPLWGEHQALNCGLALALLDKLKQHDFEVSNDHVVDGLASTRLAGRMEWVWSEPRVLIDGAHNAASVQALIRALGAHVAYDSLVLVFGCGQDKDVDGMLCEIALGADKVIFTSTRHPRVMDPEELEAKFAEQTGRMSQVAKNLQEALRLAGRAVSREDLIVVTGSFYLVGEAKKLFDEFSAKRRRSAE